MSPINLREGDASLKDPLPIDVDEDLDYPVRSFLVVGFGEGQASHVIFDCGGRRDPRDGALMNNESKSHLVKVANETPSWVINDIQVQDNSRLVRTADRVDRTAVRLTEKAAAYVKPTTTQYTVRNAATEAPLVINSNVRNGIDRFIAASATVSNVAQKSLEFAGRQAERAAELAVTGFGIRDRVAGPTMPHQGFNDAIRAVQVLANAFEKRYWSVGQRTKER